METEKEFNGEDNVFIDAEENAAPVVEEDVLVKLPFELKLNYPITVGRQVFETFVFSQRPVYRDIKHLPSDGNYKLGHFEPVIRGMTGVPGAVLELMDPVDFQRCMDVVVPFLNSGPGASG